LVGFFCIYCDKPHSATHRSKITTLGCTSVLSQGSYFFDAPHSTTSDNKYNSLYCI
jgi:hypothetical protein